MTKAQIATLLNGLAAVAGASEAYVGLIRQCCGEGWYLVAFGALAVVNGALILFGAKRPVAAEPPAPPKGDA